MMFILSVVTTVSLVGLIWFRSFQKNLYVMLNPDQQQQEEFFATVDKNNDATSLFGYIGQTFKDTYQNAKSLISGESAGNDDNPSYNRDVNNKVHVLPVSQ